MAGSCTAPCVIEDPVLPCRHGFSSRAAGSRGLAGCPATSTTLTSPSGPSLIDLLKSFIGSISQPLGRTSGGGCPAASRRAVHDSAMINP